MAPVMITDESAIMKILSYEMTKRLSIIMIGVLGHDSALVKYTGLGTTWGNEMKSAMNHDPGAGSIARPVDQQSSALPLYHGCPLSIIM